ncbi:MAG: (2Fe-2S)-binding protein [Defluviitaleaceae bacterium]|nr:(2Fe-2S)-binding protein [Defluviitaleaceae bacterium]
MLEKTGVPTQSEIESVFPSDERLSKGPVAVIECFQSIPCDPCATACPRGAILPFADINDRPVIDNDKCNGCILCMTKCPGLAIMVVDITWSQDRALIKMPYEFRPLPDVGQTVQALDREGTVVAEAEVIRVQYNKSMNKVPIVSIAVDKQLVKTIRNIRTICDTPTTATHTAIQEEAQDTGIVCRCNDLQLAEIRALIAKGYTTIAELKQMARLGMGPCQGRNCLPVVVNELSRALGVPVAELPVGSFRPMVKSIYLGDLAGYEEQGEN